MKKEKNQLLEESKEYLGNDYLNWLDSVLQEFLNNKDVEKETQQYNIYTTSVGAFYACPE